MAVDCETRDCSAWVASRVILVLLFALGGLVGNGFVFKVYWKSVKQNSQTSQLYIVLLACIDLFSCLVFLPQIPLHEWGLIPLIPMVSQTVLQSQAYLFVQVAMIVDRVFAVFRPHQFNQMRRRTNIVLTTLFVISQLTIQTSMVVSVFYTAPPFGTLVFMALFTLGLIIMLVSNPPPKHT